MGTTSTTRAAPTAGRSVYEDRWGATDHIVQLRPHLWRELVPVVGEGPVLEVGPGLRPTAPVHGSCFVETSRNATRALVAAGGRAARVGGWRLPFRDRSFRAVLALEILEHLPQDELLLREIARVLEPGGAAVISVPLHMDRWTAIDEMVHHVRRYDPQELLAKLMSAGLVPERFSVSPSRSHKALARIGVRIVSTFSGPWNWWMQNVNYRALAVWQRWFGRIRWRAPDGSILDRAGGVLVLARAG